MREVFAVSCTISRPDSPRAIYLDVLRLSPTRREPYEFPFARLAFRSRVRVGADHRGGPSSDGGGGTACGNAGEQLAPWSLLRGGGTPRRSPRNPHTPTGGPARGL